MTAVLTPDHIKDIAEQLDKTVVLSSQFPKLAFSMQHITAWEDAGRPYLFDAKRAEDSDEVLAFFDTGHGFLFALDKPLNKWHCGANFLLFRGYLVLDRVAQSAPSMIYRVAT